jgi:hypothetical protein
VFQEDGDVQNEVVARTLEARALFAQEKLAQARVAIERALAAAAKSASPIERLVPAVTAGRIRAALDAPRVENDLRAAVREATKTGLVNLQLDGRLALAEIQITSDGPGRSRALEAIEQEATEKGLALIARRAHAARRLGAGNLSAQQSP